MGYSSVNLPSCFWNPSKISSLQVPAGRRAPAELWGVWKGPPESCSKPSNYWFHFVVPNCCIPIDHSDSFPPPCLCVSFHLLCLSTPILFPILKGPNLFGWFSFGSCFTQFDDFCHFPLDIFHSHFALFQTEGPDWAQLSRCWEAMNLCSGRKHQNKCSLFLFPNNSHSFIHFFFFCHLWVFQSLEIPILHAQSPILEIQNCWLASHLSSCTCTMWIYPY